MRSFSNYIKLNIRGADTYASVKKAVNLCIIRGQKFHSSARIYEWILERTSDSSQSARTSGRVLKSAGETCIF